MKNCCPFIRLKLEARSIKEYSGVHDIALVKTKEPLNLDALIKPICLPFNTGDANSLSYFRKVQVLTVRLIKN